MGGKKRTAQQIWRENLKKKKTVSFIQILEWKCFQQLIR